MKTGKKKWYLGAGALVVVLSVIVAITAAFAATGGDEQKTGASAKGGNKMHGQMMGGPGLGLAMLAKLADKPRVKEALALTDEQVTKIKAKATAAEAPLKETRTKEKELQKALRDLISTDKPDTGKIDAAVDEITKLQAQNMKQMIHLEIDLKSILTAEQLVKVKQFQKKMQNRRGNRGGGHGMRGGGEMGGPGMGGPESEF